MKILFLLVILLASVGNTCLSYVSTTDVAQKLKYFDFINDLRNKVHDHMKNLETQGKKYVQGLRSGHKHDLAQAREEQLEDARSALDTEFDERFEDIDKILVLQGDHLDDDNAPVEEKEALINRLRQQAQALINALIRRSSLEISKHLKNS